MSIQLPTAPEVDQNFLSWRWNGRAWKFVPSLALGDFLPLDGSKRMTGELLLAGNATNQWGAVPYRQLYQALQNYLPRDGALPMEGPLVLAHNAPPGSMEPVTMTQLEALLAGLGAGGEMPDLTAFMPKSGGVFSGAVVLHADAIQPMSPVTLNQLDARLNALPAIPGPATVAPLMDGTAAVGNSLLYARQNHVHPTDTSRAATSALAGYLPLTGGTVANVISLSGTGIATPGLRSNGGIDLVDNLGINCHAPSGQWRYLTANIAGLISVSDRFGVDLYVANAGAANAVITSWQNMFRFGSGNGNCELPGPLFIDVKALGTGSGAFYFYAVGNTRFINFTGSGWNFSFNGTSNVFYWGAPTGGLMWLDAGGSLTTQGDVRVGNALIVTGSGSIGANWTVGATMTANSVQVAGVGSQFSIYQQPEGYRTVQFAGNWAWQWNMSNGDLVWLGYGIGLFVSIRVSDRALINWRGPVYGNGPYWDMSSWRAEKSEIEDIAEPVARLKRLKPRRYRHDRAAGQPQRLGFMIDDLIEDCPEAVLRDEKSGQPTGYSTTPIVAALAGAMQALTRRIEALEERK